MFGGLIHEAGKREADLLLMGWRGGFSVSQIYNSKIQRVISDAPADVAVLKNRGLEKIESILIPWGGGPHAQLGLELALRIGQVTGARIDLLRIVENASDIAPETKELQEFVASIASGYENVEYLVIQDENVADRMSQQLKDEDYNLVIIGASHEWRIRNVLFGSITDIVADAADCSVLMVRRYLTEDWKEPA